MREWGLCLRHPAAEINRPVDPWWCERLLLFLDYVGFIKKIMKQTQYPRYHLMKKVEVDMEQLTDNEQPPTGPGEN